MADWRFNFASTDRPTSQQSAFVVCALAPPRQGQRMHLLLQARARPDQDTTLTTKDPMSTEADKHSKHAINVLDERAKIPNIGQSMYSRSGCCACILRLNGNIFDTIPWYSDDPTH